MKFNLFTTANPPAPKEPVAAVNIYDDNGGDIIVSAGDMDNPFRESPKILTISRSGKITIHKFNDDDAKMLLKLGFSISPHGNRGRSHVSFGIERDDE